MATPTQSPILITSLGAPHKPTTKQTYDYLHAFLETIPSSTARTQLERLTDAIGVDIGAIAAGEGERREAERLKLRMERRAEKKRVKEEEEKKELEGMVEQELEAQFQEEEGAALEDDLEDGGDVEYGDNIVDEDEPDQDDGTRQDEVYLDQQANTVSRTWRVSLTPRLQTDDADVILHLHIAFVLYNTVAHVSTSICCMSTELQRIHYTRPPTLCLHIKNSKESTSLHIPGLPRTLALPEEYHIIIHDWLSAKLSQLRAGSEFIVDWPTNADVFPR